MSDEEEAVHFIEEAASHILDAWATRRDGGSVSADCLLSALASLQSARRELVGDGDDGSAEIRELAGALSSKGRPQ